MTETARAAISATLTFHSSCRWIGEDGDTSVIQPAWSTKTGDLFYISDETGYYNLYRAGTEGTILPMKYDLGGSAPGWALGQQGYTFLEYGRVAASYSKDGRSVLLVADVGGGETAGDVVEYGSEDGLPMMFGSVTPGGDGGVLYLMGGSPSTPTSVYRWDMDKREPATILACSSSLSFPDGEQMHIFYPTTVEPSPRAPSSHDRINFWHNKT